MTYRFDKMCVRKIANYDHFPTREVANHQEVINFVQIAGADGEIHAIWVIYTGVQNWKILSEDDPHNTSYEQVKKISPGIYHLQPRKSMPSAELHHPEDDDEDEEVRLINFDGEAFTCVEQYTVKQPPKRQSSPAIDAHDCPNDDNRPFPSMKLAAVSGLGLFGGSILGVHSPLLAAIGITNGIAGCLIGALAGCLLTCLFAVIIYNCCARGREIDTHQPPRRSVIL